MTVYDFGTVRIFSEGDDRFDTYFPAGYDYVKDILKEYKSRFDGEKKCWITIPRYSKSTTGLIVDRIKQEIIKNTNEKWLSTVEKFKGFACVTKKYEVKVGYGGIRIGLSYEHPLEWHIKKLEGVKFDYRSRFWLIGSKYCQSKEVVNILKQIVNEDMNLYKSTVEYYAGRSVSGFVKNMEYSLDNFTDESGEIIFADYSFFKVSDPFIQQAPLISWPLKILYIDKRDENEFYLKLQHFEDTDKGYKAVIRRQASSNIDKMKLLDSIHVDEKWKLLK